jgi:predicted lipid-binding transport protein (Tim44 family)
LPPADGGEELAGNASRLVNRVTDVHLPPGDLAEAWREGGTDYATVAMKFALQGSMVERASNRIVEGGERSEVAELWTFMRARGKLAAFSHPADLTLPALRHCCRQTSV